MKNKLLWVGGIGTPILALCCFTPILVIFFGLIGLSFMVPYLDYVLFPLLALFLIILCVGLCKKFCCNSYHLKK